MDDKKKKFIIPEAETVSFANEDIITASKTESYAPDDWAAGPDKEVWE